MNNFSIALHLHKIRLTRWFARPAVRRYLLISVLVLLALGTGYELLKGKTFQIYRDIPETEIYRKKFGPITLQVIPYDIEKFSAKSYALPVSDIFSGTTMQFTLQFPQALGIPVIKINHDGHTYFLGIDTTVTENVVLASGNISSRTYKMLSRHSLLWDSRTETAVDFLFPGQNEEFQFIASDDESKPPVLAGLLGLSWLQSFDNVVLDYATQQIRCNQPAVSGTAVPMEKSEIWEYLFIDFTADGSEEKGIIDTASRTVVLRRDIGSRKLPPNFFLWREIMRDFEDTNHELFTMDSIMVGTTVWDSVPVHDNMYWNYDGAVRIKRMANYYSFLGYPLWKDHVIQLDFANHLSRIQ